MAAGTTIVLDATSWQERADFYAALLPQLSVPDWLGGNLDALFDGLVAHHIGVALPLMVEVRGVGTLPADLANYLARAVQVFDDARRAYAVDAHLILVA